MLRPDRARRGPDRTLRWRMALLGTGAVLGLAGMYWSRSVLITAGIVALAAGLVLGVVSRRREQERDDGA
jgi:membrane associated rhomboid family serine protease